MTHPKHYRQRRNARVHLRAPLVVLFGLCFALAMDSTGILRVGLLCAALHESGHVLAYRWQWGFWPDLQISPWGICLMLRGTNLTPQREFLLAAAGPFVNLVGCSVVLAWMRLSGHYSYMGYWFASTNLLVGGINLLPLRGLDGERILRSLLRWR